jgi:hypothetical protein
VSSVNRVGGPCPLRSTDLEQHIIGLGCQTLRSRREVNPGVSPALPGSKVAHIAQRVNGKLSVPGLLRGCPAGELSPYSRSQPGPTHLDAGRGVTDYVL